MDKARADGSEQVEDDEANASEAIFDRWAEDEEPEHIPGQMHEAAVQEGSGDGPPECEVVAPDLTKVKQVTSELRIRMLKEQLKKFVLLLKVEQLQ